MKKFARLFDEPKPKVHLPVDLKAEIRAKGENAHPWTKVVFRPFWEYPINPAHWKSFR